MFRASSAHLQEDIVVYMQHMVPSLSIRVLVACRYAARVRTDCRGKVVDRASEELKVNHAKMKKETASKFSNSAPPPKKKLSDIFDICANRRS